MGDLSDFYKAPKINESFSRLLDRPVSTSGYILLSLDELATLEACIRGQIESQSFSLRALATIFTFLKDSSCAPEDNVFLQLVSSLTVSLNSQAKGSFSAASFLKLKRRETLVLLLPSSTHASVKHSSSSLFAEDIIRDSLAQVKEDSQLKLLKNLSSIRGGKQSASFASASSECRSSSSTSSSSSSSYSRNTSRSLRSSKRPSSSSPSCRSKVAFKGILRSPTSEKSFSK